MNEKAKNLFDIILNFLNLIILVWLGYLGYNINTTLSDIQIKADKRTIAEEEKDLWEELSKLEQNAILHSGELGKSMADCIIKIGELMDTWESQKNLRGRKEQTLYDPVIMMRWSGYEAAHFKLMSLIEKTAIEYDNARLKFSPVIKELSVKRWDKFFGQTKEVFEWKQKIFRPYIEIHDILYKTIFEGNSSNIDSHKLLRDYGYRMGQNLILLSQPYLTGLSEMKEENLKYWKGKFGS